MPPEATWWTIRKVDLWRRERARWKARLLLRTQRMWLLEAFFKGHTVTLPGLTFRPGDRMLEAYFTAYWFNIYEVYEGRDGPLKGWYANLSQPTRQIGPHTLLYTDLALDLIVLPKGEMLELDREEFLTLPLSPEALRLALEHWAALKEAFRRGQVHLARAQVPVV